MDAWRKAAIAEVGQLFQLLHRGDEFTAADLCDRLRGLLEYIEFDPTKDPHIEDLDE